MSCGCNSPAESRNRQSYQHACDGAATSAVFRRTLSLPFPVQYSGPANESYGYGSEDECPLYGAHIPFGIVAAGCRLSKHPFRIPCPPSGRFRAVAEGRYGRHTARGTAFHRQSPVRYADSGPLMTAAHGSASVCRPVPSAVQRTILISLIRSCGVVLPR